MTPAASGFLPGECHRHPEFIVLAGKLKLRRHDADNSDALAVQGDRLSDQVHIRTKTALPQAVAHDYHATCAGLIFLRRERSTELRFDAEQGEEAGGNAAALNSFRFANAGEIKTLVCDRGHAFKDLVLIAPVDIVGG